MLKEMWLCFCGIRICLSFEALTLPGGWVSHGLFSKHLPGLSLNFRTCRDQTVMVCSELEKSLRWGFGVNTSGHEKSLKSLLRSSPFLLTASGNCILKRKGTVQSCKFQNSLLNKFGLFFDYFLI